jgi:hypothetical protein
MTHFARLAIFALSLFATSAAATQGAKVTAMGFGDSRQHAKMVTIQTWTQAALQEYGFADWNTAYLGQVTCAPNSSAAGTPQYGTLSREIIKIGGNPGSSWACIVSGYQESMGG